MADKNNKEKVSDENNQAEKTSTLEWLVAGVGVILVAGTIGFLLYSAIKEHNLPPEKNVPNLTAKKSAVIAVENKYLVKFSLENSGEDNAAAITVEGKLMDGEKEVETSSASISYAPSHSTREGGLFFNENPDDSKFKLELRALGYAQP